MSAKVYSPPKELSQPPFDFGIPFDERNRRDEEYIEKLRKFIKENTASKSDLVGEEIRFPIADGYACYLVCSTTPLELLHIPLGDAWNADPCTLRGLRVCDVRKMVEGRKFLTKLFSQKD